MLLIIIPCLALASVLGLGLVMDSIPHSVSNGGGPNHTPLVILNLILDLICSLQLWKRWRWWKSWEHSIVAGIMCKCIQVMPCYICKEFEEVLKVHTFTKEKHPDCEFNTVNSPSDIRSLASRRSWADYLRFNFMGRHNPVVFSEMKSTSINQIKYIFAVSKLLFSPLDC